MKEKIFPVSSYVAINDDDGDILVKTLPSSEQQLPRRDLEAARSVRKVRLEEEEEEEEAEEEDNLQDRNENQTKKSEEEDGGDGGMAVLPVAGQI